MRYDLPLIVELSREVGLRCSSRNVNEVALDLGLGAILTFQNSVDEDDCLVGFEGMPWHAHGDLMWSDPTGAYIELEYLDVVSEIARGTVLICERWERGHLTDRWLVHRDYVDEFRHIQVGDEIRIRAAVVLEAPNEPLERSRGAAS